MGMSGPPHPLQAGGQDRLDYLAAQILAGLLGGIEGQRHIAGPAAVGADGWDATQELLAKAYDWAEALIEHRRLRRVVAEAEAAQTEAP